MAGKWPRPLASSCSRSAGELPIAQYGACMCLLPPRELELQHTVRYTVRVHEPERCRALSASFVRKTLGESERSGGECRLRAISDIVVISESAHTRRRQGSALRTHPPRATCSDCSGLGARALSRLLTAVARAAPTAPPGRSVHQLCTRHPAGMHTAPAGMHHPPRHPTRATHTSRAPEF